jgi:hypothetical protein
VAVVVLLAVLLAVSAARLSRKRTARPVMGATVEAPRAGARTPYHTARQAGQPSRETTQRLESPDNPTGFSPEPAYSIHHIPSPVDSDDYIAGIRKSFGVRVHVTYDADACFPTQWKGAPVSAHGSEIDPTEGRRAVRLIPGFLLSYPRELIAKNLKDIYLLGSMSFHGREYGGTNSRAGIYITNKGQDRGYSDEALIATMHAELSSIICRNYGFPAEEWATINDPDWRYLGKGHELLGRSDLFDQTEDLLRQGFIRVYSQASMEEDVNGYVVALIKERPMLVSAAARHTRIRQKLELLARFYERIKGQLEAAEDFDFLTRMKSALDANSKAPLKPEAGAGRQR